MAKREETTKHTLHLREGDYEELRFLHPETGAAIIIRTLVSEYVDRVRNSRDSSEPDVKVTL